MTQFRRLGKCETRTSEGKIPPPGTLLNWRVDDNCHDYFYAFDDPLFLEAFKAYQSQEGPEKWQEKVETLEQQEQQQLQANQELWQKKDGGLLWE
ncbi:hypothetical protein CDD83_5245 [Cordyceps sp. RAO-2017]|nr:hypothetical protein CDD83_5245 [Cordyceps sp. RAO-2017]